MTHETKIHKIAEVNRQYFNRGKQNKKCLFLRLVMVTIFHHFCSWQWQPPCNPILMTALKNFSFLFYSIPFKRVEFFKGLHSVLLIMSQRQRKLEFFRGDSTRREEEEEEEDPCPSISTSNSVLTSRGREDPNPSTSKETQRWALFIFTVVFRL